MDEVKLLETIKAKDAEIERLKERVFAKEWEGSADGRNPRAEKAEATYLAAERRFGQRAIRLTEEIDKRIKAEADRDRARQTIKDRTAIFVRICAATGISTDADEDDLVGAFGRLKADRDRLRESLEETRDALSVCEAGMITSVEECNRLRGEVAAMREALLFRFPWWAPNHQSYVVCSECGARKGGVHHKYCMLRFLEDSSEAEIDEAVQAMLTGKEADRG